jgi:hypothetical protein
MPYMAPTEIMTLGRLGAAFEPMVRTNWMGQPRRVTPQQPQNLLRQTTLGGLFGTARLLHGLGAVGDQVLATSASDPMVDVTQSSGDPVAMNLPGLPTFPWQKSSPTVQLGAVIATAALSLVSAGISAYHGYRRDRSVMAGVGWGFMGAIFPVVTPIVSIAQGYARPRGRR